MSRPTDDKENTMQAVKQTRTAADSPQTRTELQRWYLAVDGNQHRADLQTAAPAGKAFMLSEAMLPQIRAVACLIAASRHGFDGRSPAVFTEEADWFAARILVLGVRVFHLDVTLIPMLKTANRRAAEFARSRNLPFTPAQMRMSLHAARPHGGLIVENACFAEQDLGMTGNTQAVAERLPSLF